MSAGICIMNKHAVALAADSAVTIGQHAAIHNSANKLFALSKYEPIGVIIYANASFMQIPVEIILKEYKKQLGTKSFESLAGYVANFIQYLENNTTLFHFDINEKNYVKRLYVNLLNGLTVDYNNFINDKVLEVKRELTDEELQEIKISTVQQTISFIDGYKKLYNPVFSQYVRDVYLDEIKQFLAVEYKWVTQEQIEELSNKICDLYDTDFMRDGYVGIAFAGYGTSDIFPEMCHMHICGVINKKVRYTLKECIKIDEGQDASIIPFAQTDVMQTFLFGINDTFIQDMAAEIPKQINQRISAMDENVFSAGKKNEVLRELNGATNSIIQSIAMNANTRYMKPIIQSVATLPIEELALLAESMINITSLRRKVALDGNVGTVGGPIDLAIISKGDGFVWMKRKHYFDLKYNPQYLVTHYTNFDNNEVRYGAEK